MRRSYTNIFLDIRYVENKQNALVGTRIIGETTTEASRLREVLNAADISYNETLLHRSRHKHSVSGSQKFKKIGSVLLDNLTEDQREGRIGQIGCSCCGSKLPSKVLRCLFCNYQVCSNCFTEDLLIYMPSDEEMSDSNFWPNKFEKIKNGTNSKCIRWAIIGKSGYPEHDPSFFEYFPLCSLCKVKLVAIKRSEYSDYQRLQFSSDCENFYISLTKSKLNIEQCLSEMKKVFRNPSSTNGSILKLQEDIETKLDIMRKSLAPIDQLSPKTNTQNMLTKNLTKANQDWFNQTKDKYESLLQEIYNSTPLKTLTEMQCTVEKMALCSALTVVKEVFEEEMRLCREYGLSFAVLNEISTVESSMWSNLSHLDDIDMEEFVSLKTNVESHVASMIMQDKGIKFTISQLKLDVEGKSYVLRVITESAAVHLTRIMKDLSLKCRKRVVEDSIQSISALVSNYKTKLFTKPLTPTHSSSNTHCPKSGDGRVISNVF